MDFDEINKIYEDNRILKTITIEIVNQCNWNCKHCYLDKKILYLKKEKIFEIIDQARDLGAFEVRLSGGEVTISPYLADIISYARTRYMNVILLSNMWQLKADVLECIKTYGIERVEVTLFSTKDKIHNTFVGVKDALQNSLKNIAILKNLGVDILVKTWAIKSNYNELEFMHNYFTEKGYRFSVNVQIYSDIHGEMKLPKEERLSYAEYCHALYLHDKSVNRVFPINNVITNKLCTEYLTSIYITSSGEVIPCAKFRKSIANIYDSPLKEIWNSSSALHKIQNYCWKDCDGCIECKMRSYCVRCGAMAYIKGHDYLENCRETCLLAAIRMAKYEAVEQGETY